MPEARKPRKSLKFLTIAAIVLLVIVLVPYAVIEKARRDVKKLYSSDARIELREIEFDAKEFVILKFAPVSNPDSSLTITVNWSLAQWGVPDFEIRRVILEQIIQDTHTL